MVECRKPCPPLHNAQISRLPVRGAVLQGKDRHAGKTIQNRQSGTEVEQLNYFEDKNEPVIERQKFVLSLFISAF